MRPVASWRCRRILQHVGPVSTWDSRCVLAIEGARGGMGCLATPRFGLDPAIAVAGVKQAHQRCERAEHVEEPHRLFHRTSFLGRRVWGTASISAVRTRTLRLGQLAS